MEVETFQFPSIDDGVLKLQEKYCDMLNKYRDSKLSPEEIDWMDWANNALTDI